MKTLKLFIVITICCTVISCYGPLPKFKHYISSYVNPSEMSIIRSFFDTETSYALKIIIELDNPDYSSYMNPHIYDSLCVANNDVQYNKYPTVDALMYETKSISVICNQNYDSQYPAGSPLDGYFKINYYSAYGFIQSRYKDFELAKDKVEFLNDFNSKETPLMRSMFILTTKKIPETAGDYTFTITYKDSKGKTLSVTTEPVTLPARN